MRSYRRLTMLGVFGAVGVGLAIGVGTSMTPAPSTDVATAAPPAVSRTLAKQAAASDYSRPSPIRVLPAPKRPASENIALPAERVDARTGSLVAQSYPALAQQHEDSSPKPATSEALLKAFLGQTKTPDAAEPAPPALPSPEQAMPPEPKLPLNPPPAAVPGAAPGRNSIHRCGGALGDRFAINILDADIREVLDLLSKEGSLNILASPKVQGKVSATLNNVDLESALDAILKSTGYVAKREGRFLFVGKPDDFTQMARTTDEIKTRIYHPSYVTSAELKNLIEPILTSGVGIISVTTEAKSGIPANMTDLGGDNYAGGDALLVRDYEAVLREVDQLVAEVDLRPLQVHIEAMILSVKLNDQNKFGVDFQVLRQFHNLKFGWGSVPTALSEVKFDGGLKFGFLDSSLGSFINALESVGDTNVIATPRLMVVNKHAAEIQIGKSEGYVNTTQTETAATQTVEFLELGTLLRIRPFISNDGMIRMEVHPEISDGEVNVEQGFTLPKKQITQVTTNILIRDGCTAVIGGLLQDEQRNDRKQIPLLGSMPIVGIAFRDTDEHLARHELIILITPRVVWEREAYREGVTQNCEFQRRQAVYAEKMSSIGKRSLARKYFRRAQAAWAEGDRRKALRMAELAVHFDPLNRQAIELRSDIWLGKSFQSPYAVEPIAVPPGAGSLDGPQVAPWVLQRLGNTAQPGVPGPMDLQPTPGDPMANQVNSQPDSSVPLPNQPELNLDPPEGITVLPTPPPEEQKGK
ncbi:MAG: secretin and TonB N-terminal domain-containing protein [Pirellulales bacterium]|nr:secretin and TonB N-terminal domain-containing protein [Pirellulales bacterium]